MARKDLKTSKNILYTGFGDKGTTTLFHCDQGRISKSANIIEALGATDELNAYLGVVKVHAESDQLKVKIGKKKISYDDILESVQQVLFIIQAEIGGSKISVKKADVNKVEKIIHGIENTIPPIKSFTVSGGSLLSANLDYSRTLARRCERRLIAVAEEGSRVFSTNTLSYLNRLSSLLFALSRYTNYLLSIEETHPTYNKKK